MKFKHINCTSFSLAAQINGVSRMIDFSEGGNTPFFRHAMLITDDPKVIEAVKNCGLYGTEIIDAEEAEEEKPLLVIGETVVYDEVTTVQAAKDLLIKNHGGIVSKLPNKIAIMAFAKENNISFPNLPE